MASHSPGESRTDEVRDTEIFQNSCRDSNADAQERCGMAAWRFQRARSMTSGFLLPPNRVLPARAGGRTMHGEDVAERRSHPLAGLANSFAHDIEESTGVLYSDGSDAIPLGRQPGHRGKASPARVFHSPERPLNNYIQCM